MAHLVDERIEIPVRDDWPVTLRPFDTIIQGGVNHAWSDRCNTPTLVLAIVMDERPQRSSSPRIERGAQW